MLKLKAKKGKGKEVKGLMQNRIRRREFLASTAAAAAGMLWGPRIWPAGGPGPGRAAITVRSRGQLRILAVTDLHFFGRETYKDAKTMKDIGRMVELYEPDVMVVCGDLWFNNPSGRGVDFCRRSCERRAQFQVPWALARGNHDQADNSGRAEDILAHAPYSLYRGGQDGNYTITASNPGETAPFWNLIMINDAYPEMGFREPQMEWLLAETARLQAEKAAAPAFLFAHIPLPQFEDLALSGGARGVKMERVCFEAGSPEALAVIRDTGLVKAMFCGHDHLNNFSGVMEGVHLHYLRATGYAGYGGARVHKGGTVITAAPANGEILVETVFARGSAYAWEKEAAAGEQ
jgi:hypothetical protein